MKSQKTTNDIYQELHDNLLYPCLFYISLELLDKLSENKKLVHLDKLKHVVFALENNTYNFEVKKDSDLSFLLSKSQKLSSNVFTLVDYQTILSENQFFVLLKKYKRQLDAYVEVSELLVKGIDDTSKPIFQTIKGHFLMQEMNLKEHQKVINESFPILQGIAKPKIKWNTIFNENSLIDSKTINLNKENKTLGKIVVPKKQQLIIDPIEIQDYLITSVFSDNKKV